MERNGGLRKLQAAARAEAYRALGAGEDGAARPEPCGEALVVNELIREYLVFNGLRCGLVAIGAVVSVSV
jgi:hypothetical protein